MFTYLIKDVRAGETPNYYGSIGHAPQAIYSEYPQKIEERVIMNFWVDAFPGHMAVPQVCEVVDIKKVGTWPFRKTLLHIKPLSLEASAQSQPKCTTRGPAVLEADPQQKRKVDPAVCLSSPDYEPPKPTNDDDDRGGMS